MAVLVGGAISLVNSGTNENLITSLSEGNHQKSLSEGISETVYPHFYVKVIFFFHSAWSHI